MNSTKFLQIGVALLLYIALFTFIIFQVSDVLDFSSILDNRIRLFKGAGLTLFISILSLFSSMILGFIIFLMTESNNYFMKSVAAIYKEIIMGTPLLVLVFIVVYIVGVALHIDNKLLLGFQALTLYMSPYMTNIFDGAYRSIDTDQFVIMDFYKFTIYQKYRYIILPQMVKPILPGLINNLSGIIKGTSILSTIGISEIFYTTSILSNTTYRYIEGYFVLWAIYLLITIPLSILAQYFVQRDKR